MVTKNKFVFRHYPFIKKFWCGPNKLPYDPVPKTSKCSKVVTLGKSILYPIVHKTPFIIITKSIWYMYLFNNHYFTSLNMFSISQNFGETRILWFSKIKIKSVILEICFELTFEIPIQKFPLNVFLALWGSNIQPQLDSLGHKPRPRARFIPLHHKGNSW